MALKVSLFMTYRPRVPSDGHFHGTDFVAIATVSSTLSLHWLISINEKLGLSPRRKKASRGFVTVRHVNGYLFKSQKLKPAHRTISDERPVVVSH